MTKPVINPSINILAIVTVTDRREVAGRLSRSAGAVAKQYAGKPGVEEVSTNSAGQPTCYSAVQISQGIAAMVTVLPSDPCRANRVVLEQVAQKVP